ncbi:MAG: PKD domain-containing protein, partial [Flavobacteriaceae bacterium]|nr:PKD domain-containing protein [Flavobacteriaceae bacterium]
ISIIVSDPANLPPVAFASATPSSGTLPLEVNFTGSNSTDDVGVVSYLWDFKDGSPLATEADPVHTFTTAGTYLVQLTVADEEGLTDTATVTVIVNDGINQAPVAIIDATPLQGDAPLEVNFTGRNSTDDKGVVGYLWDFGDGSGTSTEITPNHIFALDGNYTVSLTVTDAEGLSNTTSIIITVLELSGTKDLYGLILVNPAKEIAQVRIVDNGPANRSVTRIYIHNVSGQQVAVYNPQDVFVNGLYEIPISRLGSGTIYLIGFEMNSRDTVVLKLVVMN